VRILFDQGTPVPLRHALITHSVETAFELGWHTLPNGDLLDAAEAEGFEVFITTDQNLRHQQDLSGRRLAIVVLLTADWRLIQQYSDRVGAALVAAAPGSYVELAFPPTG